MNAEQHLRALIGDLVIRVAQQAAENDALRDALAAAQAPKTPEQEQK